MHLFASGLGSLKRSSKQTTKHSEVKVNNMISHVYFNVLLEPLKRNDKMQKINAFCNLSYAKWNVQCQGSCVTNNLTAQCGPVDIYWYSVQTSLLFKQWINTVELILNFIWICSFVYENIYNFTEIIVWMICIIVSKLIGE